MVAYSLCRSATVAANMALMRIWYPSGNAFSIEKLSMAIDAEPDLSQDQLHKLRKVMKRDRATRDSIVTLTAWRSRRIAHRESDYIAGQEPITVRATQADFDRLVDHSLKILGALREVLPEAQILDLERMRQDWSEQAQEFWRMLHPGISPSFIKEVLGREFHSPASQRPHHRPEQHGDGADRHHPRRPEPEEP
jgi:hypothetical protein